VDVEPADHSLGRSRGGLTTKLHLAVEQGQRPLSVVVTAGQRGDSPQFEAVMAGIRVPRLGRGRPRTRPNKVRADKAYSSRHNRAYLRRRGIGCTIPRRTTRSATASGVVLMAVGRRGSASSTIASAMPWSAGSTASSATVRWRPVTTSSASATRPPCLWPQSTNGYDF
jgi:hypothetical protein